jgi:hypothetical protein
VRRRDEGAEFGVGDNLEDGVLDGGAGALAAGVGHGPGQTLGQHVDDRVQAIELVTHTDSH